MKIKFYPDNRILSNQDKKKKSYRFFIKYDNAFYLTSKEKQNFEDINWQQCTKLVLNYTEIHLHEACAFSDNTNWAQVKVTVRRMSCRMIDQKQKWMDHQSFSSHNINLLTADILSVKGTVINHPFQMCWICTWKGRRFQMQLPWWFECQIESYII